MTRRSTLITMLYFTLTAVILAILPVSSSAMSQNNPTPTITPTLRSPDSREPITQNNAARVALLAEITTHEGLPQAVDFSSDGSQLAVGGHDGTVALVDVQTGTLLMRFVAHPLPVDLVVFVPGDSRLITAGWDKTIRVWGIGQQQGYLIRGIPSDTRIFDLAIRADLLASAHGDGSVHIRSLGDYTEIVALQTPANAAYSVAFSPDGSQLAVGTDIGMIAVFATDTWEELQTIPSPAQWIRGVAFSPQGKVLGTGILGVQAIPEEYINREEWVTESLDPLVMSVRGDWLLLSTGGGLLLWAFPSGKQLVSIFDYFSEHDFDAALSPDRTLIAVTTSKGTVQLWGVP